MDMRQRHARMLVTSIRLCASGLARHDTDSGESRTYLVVPEVFLSAIRDRVRR